MTRVYSRRSRQGAHGAPAFDRPRAVRKKKPYKIVLEVITQEKKKLHSILSYTANAPPGYSFVPVGHPDLTEYCKERCRTRNLDVHVVSAKPRNKAHENPEKISHHVHRIGHHFPNEVISEACDVLGYQFRNGTYSKRAHNYDESRLARSLADAGQRMLLHGRPATDTESKTQIRAAVRDLFPKIPDEDLKAIVTHAFEEGSKRVGNAMQLTLARRVQLAVVAHIRHAYTDYDQLLKTTSWMEARTQVEHVSLAKLREWRDEGDTNELEETFREVIVIDDDDDDSSSDEDSFLEANQRETSLEIVSSRATAHELQHNEPDDLVWVGARRVGRAPRRLIFLPSTHSVSRSSTVARTFNAYPTEQVSRTYAQPLPPITPIKPSQEYHQSLSLARSRPMDLQPRTAIVRPQRPLQIRGEDGQLYNLQPIVESNNSTRLAHGNGINAPYYPREEYVQPVLLVNSPESNNPNRVVPTAASRRPSEQDFVIPSIEREPEPIPSPRHVLDATYHSRRDQTSDVAMYPTTAGDNIPRTKWKEPTKPMHSYDREEAYIEQTIKPPPKPRYIQAERSALFRQPQTVIPRQIHNYEDFHIRPQPPRHEVIDLTQSSPSQLPYSRGRDGPVVPVHSYSTTRPGNYSRVPVRSLSSYYEYPPMESPRAELPIPWMSTRDDLRDDPVRREPYRHPLTLQGRAPKGSLAHGDSVQ